MKNSLNINLRLVEEERKNCKEVRRFFSQNANEHTYFPSLYLDMDIKPMYKAESFRTNYEIPFSSAEKEKYVPPEFDLPYHAVIKRETLAPDKIPALSYKLPTYSNTQNQLNKLISK
jgi:hypothetical protein